MGCSLSLHHKVMDSSPKPGHAIEFLESAQTLVKHFDEIKSCQKSKKLFKCIFIFGGSGSSKGEFIWDLMQRHAREEELNQINLKRFMMQPESCESKGCADSETARKRFKFSYIDIEKLVALNIKKRIRELVRESNTQRGNRLYVAREIDHETSSSSCDHSESQEDDDDEEDQSPEPEEYDEDMRIEKIKPYLTEFANVVTFNWILKLIESEIKRRGKQNQNNCPSTSHHSASNRLRRFSLHLSSQISDEPETIFLVNLLPNRINLFKKCLYLNQTPNLNHAQFDYFAINLTRIESEKKKDLDVVSTGTSFLDETNNTFVKYFRSLGKLVEFRIKDDHHNMNQSTHEKNGLTIKLSPKTDEKQAVIVRNVDQLKSLLRNHLHNLSINSDKTNFADSGCSKSNKVLLVNVDHFRRESEENVLVCNEENRNLNRKSKSPPSPLIFMVGNRIELEDHKVTVLVDESFCDTNIVRPFVNCLRQVLQEMSEKGSE